jgi:hypothetical protein
VGKYVIRIVDRKVYWTHGDRPHSYLLGEFDSWRAARRCALEWSRRTGRTVEYEG